MKAKIASPWLMVLPFFFIIAEYNRDNIEIELKTRIDPETKTIVCPENPLFGTLILKLSSPLTIGSETDDRYFFASLRQIRIDKKRRIYAPDAVAARIQVYDMNGKYIKTIGRRGQGPGEFMRPFNLFLDDKENIYVLDAAARKISRFSDNCECRDSISLMEISILNFCVDGKGNIFLSSLASEPDGNMHVNFIKLEPKENVKKIVMSDFFLKMIIDGQSRIFYDHPYQQNHYFSLLNNGNIVFVKALEPSLYYLSDEGEILLRVIRQESPGRISMGEKETVLKKSFKWLKKERWKEVYFPEHRPIYSNLLIDDTDRIYLEKFNPINKQNYGYSYNIFNKTGEYLYKLDSDFRIAGIGYGHVYTIQINEESGEIKLIRHKIENWGRIKEGI
jgi:hypothetical protein